MLEYDVIGHPESEFQFATCFPFFPAAAEQPARVCVLREYCQGPHKVLYNLPTGAAAGIFAAMLHAADQSVKAFSCHPDLVRQPLMMGMIN